MGLGRLVAKLAGASAEYELLQQFRELPASRQQEIVEYGKKVYEEWAGGLLPPGTIDERELYRLYTRLPSELQRRIRAKGTRVYKAWKKEGGK